MAMLKRTLAALYYPCAAVLVAELLRQSAEADRLLVLAAEMQSFDGAARMAWAKVLETLSFTWYTGATDLAVRVTTPAGWTIVANVHRGHVIRQTVGRCSSGSLTPSPPLTRASST